jgi:hypothetical protein
MTTTTKTSITAARLRRNTIRPDAAVPAQCA